METTDTDPFQTTEIPDLQMACITYLNSFPAPNALEILKQSAKHGRARGNTIAGYFSGKPTPRPVNPAVLPEFRERYAQILGEPSPK